MPRIVKNKNAVALANENKAAYGDGKKPEIIKKCPDSFYEVMQAVAFVTKQITALPIPDRNAEIIETCSIIMASLNAYHEAMEKKIGGIEVNPIVDTSMLNEINAKLEALIQMSMQKENKEWVFHVERDETDKLLRVKATQTIH